MGFFSWAWRCLAWLGLGAWLAAPCLAGSFPGDRVAKAAPDALASCQAGTPAALPPLALPLDKVTVLTSACVLPGGEEPPGATSAWRLQPLPHIWRMTHPDYQGVMWYRFQINLSSVPKAPWAVYLPRVIMNGQVWINGIPLPTSGSMTPPVTRNAYVPLMEQVPPHFWHAGDNTIYIKVVSGFVSRDGLATVQIGPLAQIESSYTWRSLAQVDGFYFASITQFALGIFMIMMWFRDREQRAVGFLGLAGTLWSAGTMALRIPHPFWGPPVWETSAYIAVVWGQLLMCLFFWRFVGRRWLWADVLVYGLMAISLVLVLVHPSNVLTAITFGLIYVVMLVSLAQAVYFVFKQRRHDRGWMATGCMALVLASAYDLAFKLDVLPMDTIYLLPYVSPLMMIGIFYMLAGDYARSRRALNNINDKLAITVAQREQELRASFERLSQLERAQAVSAERSRILRDMHDGVGAHLTSALRQLQSPRDAGVDIALVTQTLRDSLDQLKLSIDALSLPAGDVQGLLASLRFRITPRLKAAGIELVWDVTDLPPWQDGQAPALRQLQYILFEGLSNALQHSGATRITLSARASDDHLQLSLSDNGHGWTGSGEGQGVQAMQARASVIGAKIAFLESSEGGVELRVLLPLHKEGQADLSSAA